MVEESEHVCASQLGSALSAEMVPFLICSDNLVSFWGKFWCSVVWGADSYRIASKKMHI